MRFKFKTRELRLLYTEKINAYCYPPGVVDGFFKAMQVIASANSEADIRALKSLHYEKLSGDRSGQFSLRLNKQFRLIVEIEKDEQGKWLLIIEIVDYH